MTSAFAPDSRAARTLDLLVELVRAACVNDLTPESGHEERAAAILERFFDGAPVDLTRIEPAPGRTTLVVSLEGTDPDAEPLTLLGHTDVVPADAAHWSRDPFGGEVAGGAVHGRGVVDMLHLTASMAVVVRDLAVSGRRPKGRLVFVAEADEEARGGLGVPWIGEHMPDAIPWDNCLSEMGGSHIHGADGSDAIVVVVGEKGCAQRRIRFTGDPGHGSVPYGRRSALENLVEGARRIAGANLPVSRSDLWAAFVAAFGFAPEVAKPLIAGDESADYSAFGPLAAYAHAISRLTIAQTAARAGGPINVLPSSASLDLDIRTLPGQDDDAVDAVLRRALGDLAPVASIERLLCEEATESPTTTRLYAAIERTLVAQHPGSAVLPVLFPGGTDLRVARRLGGVGYGFGSCASERTLDAVYAQMHAHDESLPLDDLALTVDALATLVDDFLGDETS
ncbi:M20/M25/M40 family metallo-hydrolase [Actinomyces culturomici]|uniref:M20/M25/M40 family metallo-hydrolase n=1 Tax=Actinomyces culturomici TaxID=1926276 RepID=UPI000E203CFB|nr:M20/M25/M40 family metallo-hydrolase [Actinomyces culturomici]